jgi:hypothetical protein
LSWVVDETAVVGSLVLDQAVELRKPPPPKKRILIVPQPEFSEACWFGDTVAFGKKLW